MQGSRVPLLSLAALAVLTLAGCDNPACVFSGDCSDGGGGGGLGTAAATLPPNGAVLRDGAPTVERLAPSGTMISTTTPIAVVFSESMALDTLVDSVRVVPLGVIGGPISILGPALVGDGRVLVVVPANPLMAGQAYEVRFAMDAVVTDLTGTELVLPSDLVIGSFTVAATDPTAPRVVTTFPADNVTGVITSPEIAVLFDRRINAATVDNASFRVTVGGAAPPDNPLPQPLSLMGSGGGTFSETRAYTWKSVDAAGDPVSLGAGAMVQVDLSPMGDPILSTGGGTLAPTSFDFTLASVDAPLAAAIVSAPDDAIGIEALDGDGMGDLGIDVTLVDGQPGDELSIFLFGGLRNANPPRLAALLREVTVNAAGTLVALTEAEVDLASGTSPVTVRFEEGELALAFRLRRGSQVSAVRRLDADPATPGIQNVLLDVTAPTLVGLGGTGTNLTSFRSDQRGLALLGRADEELLSVQVSVAGMGDNAPVAPVVGVDGGPLPPVVGSRFDGLFAAAPVPLGLVDPDLFPLDFDVTIHDRALNAAATTTATFTQIGVVRDQASVPAGMLRVEAFDLRNGAAVVGATVLVHSDQGGAPTFDNAGTTGPTGSALVAFPAAGAAVVTVDAPGFDLFTWHGAQASLLGVPLTRTSGSTAFSQGLLSTPDVDVTTLTRRVTDGRLPSGAEPFLSVASCTFNGVFGLYECPFGPVTVRAGLSGAVSALGFDVPSDPAFYSPLTFLKAFALAVPAEPLVAAGFGDEELFVEAELDAPGVDPEERPLDGPAPLLDATGTGGLGGVLNGAPRVAVQARLRGLPGQATLGAGVAFPVMGMASQWDVRAAYPGAADVGPVTGALGRLVTEGVIEPALELRVEVRDTIGNVAGNRQPFASVGGVLSPADAPSVTSPPAGGNTGAPPWNVDVTGVPGGAGLVRVTLRDATGRGWTLLRPAAGGTLTVPVPADDLGVALLADGTIDCSVSTFALPGFDPASFAWTDVERDHRAFGHAAAISFSQP